MKLLHSLTLISVASALLLASPQSKEEIQMQELVKLGKLGSSALGKTLSQNMQEHMKKGGPMDALNFCSSEAYDLTQSTNEKLPEGVSVKRVSTRYRSTVNAPTKNEQLILESLETLQKSGAILPEYLVEKVSEDKFNYYKPLLIDNAACLKCHGNVQDPALKEAIEARYPDDMALGYEMNEFRGAVVVTIEASKAIKPTK